LKKEATVPISCADTGVCQRYGDASLFEFMIVGFQGCQSIFLWSTTLMQLAGKLNHEANLFLKLNKRKTFGFIVFVHRHSHLLDSTILNIAISKVEKP
jgi:hypothetical protein